MADPYSLDALPLAVFSWRRGAPGAQPEWQAPTGGLLAELGLAPGDAAGLRAAVAPQDAAALDAWAGSPQPPPRPCLRLRATRADGAPRSLHALAATGGDAASRLITLAPDPESWHPPAPPAAPAPMERDAGGGDASAAALAAGAQRYREFAELSSDWYWEQDAQFRFSHFSREFEQVTGMPLTRALGKTRWDGLGAERLGNVDWDAHRRQLEARQPFRDFEYPSRRPDGRLVWFRVSGKPQYDAEGRFCGYVGIASDISASRAMEHGLHQAQRMAAVGQLAAGLAHEINNPLGFVRSNLDSLGDALQAVVALADQLLAHGVEHPDTAARLAAADLDFVREDGPTLVAESRAGLDRVQRIVADLRTFASEGRTDWVEQDLHLCLEQALVLATRGAGAGLTLVRAFDTGLPAMRHSPQHLTQAVAALVRNAVQAVGDGPGTISLTTRREADGVVIEVRDSGPGIDEQHLARVFEPFFTTRPVGQGQGLGLAICAGIATEHGGRVEASRPAGGGALLRLTLPLAPHGGN